MARRIYYLVHTGAHKPHRKNKRGGRLTVAGRAQMVAVADVLRPHPIAHIRHDGTPATLEALDLLKPDFPDARLTESVLPEAALPPAPPFPIGKPAPQEQTLLSALAAHHDPLQKQLESLLRPEYVGLTYELILTHGNALRYILCYAMQAPLHAITGLNVQPGSISRMVIEPDGSRTLIRVTGINMTGHLPAPGRKKK